MDFGANKKPVKVIKEGAFEGTYFRGIYLDVHGKWYRKTWKELDELKNIDQNYYCSNYYDVSHVSYLLSWRTDVRVLTLCPK